MPSDCFVRIFCYFDYNISTSLIIGVMILVLVMEHNLSTLEELIMKEQDIHKMVV